jgi:hypothetical protein
MVGASFGVREVFRERVPAAAESGLHGAGWDAELVGDGLDRQVREVMQRDHLPLGLGKGAERRDDLQV